MSVMSVYMVAFKRDGSFRAEYEVVASTAENAIRKARTALKRDELDKEGYTVSELLRRGEAIL